MARKVTQSTARSASAGKARAAKPAKTANSAKATKPVKPTATATQIKSATKPPKAAATMCSTPHSRDQINVRAYEIWLRKGRPPGQDQQNWFEAEAELLGKASPLQSRSDQMTG